MSKNVAVIPRSQAELEHMIKRIHRRPINRYLLIRAMKAIEGLATDDVAGTADEKLQTIYRLAHASLNHCGNNHDEWKREVIDVHKAMVKIGASEP